MTGGERTCRNEETRLWRDCKATSALMGRGGCCWEDQSEGRVGLRSANQVAADPEGLVQTAGHEVHLYRRSQSHGCRRVDELKCADRFAALAERVKARRDHRGRRDVNSAYGVSAKQKMPP